MHELELPAYLDFIPQLESDPRYDSNAMRNTIVSGLERADPCALGKDTPIHIKEKISLLGQFVVNVRLWKWALQDDNLQDLRSKVDSSIQNNLYRKGRMSLQAFILYTFPTRLRQAEHEKQVLTSSPMIASPLRLWALPFTNAQHKSLYCCKWDLYLRWDKRSGKAWALQWSSLQSKVWHKCSVAQQNASILRMS